MSSKTGKKVGPSKGGGAGKTRSAVTVFDFDEEFPPMKEFTPSDKLPDYKSVVGVVRYSLEKKGKGVTTVNMAAQ